MKILRVALWSIAATAVIGVAIAFGLYAYRPGMLAYEAHLVPQARDAGEARGPLIATWWGTASVLLSDGEYAVLVDPFFTRPPGLLNLALNRAIAPDAKRIAASLKKAGVLTLEAVLVSHSHHDHAMDAGIVAQLTSAPLLGSPSTANIGRGAGLEPSQIITVMPGVPLQRGPFRITFIRSAHAGATGGYPTGEITEPLTPPAGYFDYKEGGTYSILIEHPRGSVLHHGSAGFVPGALKGPKADVVFLSVAAIDDLPSYLHEVVDAVGAKRVIPIHWDDFTAPLDSPPSPMPVAVHLDRFFTRIARSRPDLKVETLRMGQAVRLLE